MTEFQPPTATDGFFITSAGATVARGVQFVTKTRDELSGAPGIHVFSTRIQYAKGKYTEILTSRYFRYSDESVRDWDFARIVYHLNAPPERKIRPAVELRDDFEPIKGVSYC